MTKSKPKIYLETTLFNYYFLKDSSRQVQIEATKKLFQEIKRGRWNAFISPGVIQELRKSDGDLKKQMLNLLKLYPITLLAPGEFNGFLALANLYIKSGIIPKKKRADARHVSIATLTGMDILVSWNQKHIVRFKTQELIRVINISQGLNTISINTPEEVITYEE